MKIAELMDASGNLTSLHSALKLVIFDGKREEISLAYGRISNIDKVEYLFGKNLLYGERNYLRIATDFIIDGDKFVRNENSEYFDCKDAQLCLGNSEISSGSLFGDEISFFYPLPFRDNSILTAILFDILDYDLMREIYRVLKKNGKLKIMVSDVNKGGLSIKDALRYIIKFKVDKISWDNGYWIVEARKTR